MELGIWVQMENHERAVFRHLNMCCEEAIFGERLILRTGHQGFIDQSNVLSTDAFRNERMKAVIGANHALMQLASFGRVWVRVLEVGEVC